VQEGYLTTIKIKTIKFNIYPFLHCPILVV
jgi:hypothetical protein